MLKSLFTIAFVWIPGVAIADLSQYSTAELLGEVAGRIDGNRPGETPIGGVFEIDFSCSSTYGVKFVMVSATASAESQEFRQYSDRKGWISCGHVIPQYRKLFGGRARDFKLVKICDENATHTAKVTPSKIEIIQSSGGGRDSCFQSLGIEI